MTCSVRKPRGGRATEIAGTWDFKWPLGTEIRVAFQRPPNLSSDDTFANARREVIALARRWEEAISQQLANSNEVDAADFFQNGIRFSFPDDLVFDAPAHYDFIVAEEHRSPFLVDERRRQYDVLVSFEDLPLNRHRARSASERNEALRSDVEDVGIEVIAAPTSELGCYARRRDFGIPTIYIGRFGEYGQAVKLDEYYTYPLVQHVVVHEFGHVLGLAHEHQNPHLDRVPYRQPGDIRVTYAEIFRLKPDHISDRDVMEQVTDAWPGSPRFSDWNDFEGDDKPTLYDLESIMSYPFHHLFLKPRLKPGEAPSGREVFDAIEQVKANLIKLTSEDARGDKPNGHPELYGLLTHPTDTDVANLVRMYAPPRRWRQARAPQQ
jgi:hypothetical protein